MDYSSAFTRCAAYVVQEPTRKLINTLQAGTFAMREAGQLYLPKEKLEKQDDYTSRLSRSVLFNQFTRTLKAAVGKVLSQPLSFKLGEADLPKPMADWIEDIDLEGNHIDQFTKTVFNDAVAHGVSYILADMPVSATPKEKRTRKTDLVEGLRPYLVHVPNARLINWRHERINGVYTLTMAAIDESGMVPDGPFGEKLVERVRVLFPGYYVVIQRDVTGQKVTDPTTGELVDEVVYTPISQGPTGFPVIPLVPVYTNRVGRFIGQPPLQNLAELNLRWWQSASDQANILKIARVVFIARTRNPGTGDDEGEDFVLGSTEGYELETGEDVWFVEHSGAAIAAGRQDLLDLEDKMTKVGFQMVARETSGDVTATEQTLMSAEAHAALTAMAENLKDALELALKLMAAMGGLGTAAATYEPEVIINKDFGSTQTATDVPLLLQLQQANVIDANTVLLESKRRGLLSEDVRLADPVTVTANTVQSPS